MRFLATKESEMSGHKLNAFLERIPFLDQPDVEDDDLSLDPGVEAGENRLQFGDGKERLVRRHESQVVRDANAVQENAQTPLFGQLFREALDTQAGEVKEQNVCGGRRT